MFRCIPLLAVLVCLSGASLAQEKSGLQIRKMPTAPIAERVDRSAPTQTIASTQEPILGEIRTFGFNFCPRGWAAMDGQILPISQNQALYSLLGTTYGGDGRVTFALPDLRGRVVVGVDQGPGLTRYRQGHTGGVEQSTLSIAQAPAHEHDFSSVGAAQTVNVRNSGGGNSVNVISTLGAATDSTQTVGSGQAHDNRQPYLAMTSCIALSGIYPSRN